MIVLVGLFLPRPKSPPGEIAFCVCGLLLATAASGASIEQWEETRPRVASCINEHTHSRLPGEINYRLAASIGNRNRCTGWLAGRLCRVVFEKAWVINSLASRLDGRRLGSSVAAVALVLDPGVQTSRHCRAAPSIHSSAIQNLDCVETRKRSRTTSLDSFAVTKTGPLGRYI